MNIDQTTLNDLSIFNSEEDFSVFSKLNYTLTSGGRAQLRQNLSSPLSDIAAIQGVQQTLRLIKERFTEWPSRISNGTLMVVERFYDATIDDIPGNGSAMAAYSYKIFHGPDFSLVKYSVIHCFDFIKGMQQFVERFLSGNAPAPFKANLEAVREILNKPQFNIVAANEKAGALNLGEQLQLAHFLRYHYKHHMQQLIALYCQLDAWYGMAMAVKQHGLVFPELIEGDKPVLQGEGLFHLLLPKPVAYDVQLDNRANFIFLTGANMAGKSTFIKSVGAAVFLAHVGMGVPARSLRLTLFDGLLSNINVADNIVKGESYFYNEVQRIKATVAKVTDGRKWLILIDELFKGTNIQDAMKCSSAVIQGLLKVGNSLFVLSTHLYEIGEELKQYPNISFKYFETTVAGDALQFSYQLKDGISNDRLGYLILKKEGVVEMLQKL
jgi:DNA mismatch repair protein MutS